MKKSTVTLHPAYRQLFECEDTSKAEMLPAILRGYAFKPKPQAGKVTRRESYIRAGNQANTDLRCAFLLAGRVETQVSPYPSGPDGFLHDHALVQIDFYLERQHDPFFGISAMVELETGDFDVHSARYGALYELKKTLPSDFVF